MVSDGWPDGPCERVYAMKFALPEIAERASAICDEARGVANWPVMHDNLTGGLFAFYKLVQEGTLLSWPFFILSPWVFPWHKQHDRIEHVIEYRGMGVYLLPYYNCKSPLKPP